MDHEVVPAPTTRAALGWRFRRALLCLTACCFALAACGPFFELSSQRAREAAVTPPDPVNVSSLWGAVAGLYSVGPGIQPPVDEHQPSIRFLHVSDVHIRDWYLFDDPGVYHKLQHNEQLPFLGSSLRRPLVEKFTGLNYAALLIGFEQEVGRELQQPSYSGTSRHRFIINTGDLVDVSLVRELQTGLGVMVRGTGPAPLLAVPGNHDGLTFGNVPEWKGDTQELGVNQSEFILAHLLYGDQDGFGFGWNEISGRMLPPNQCTTMAPRLSRCLNQPNLSGEDDERMKIAEKLCESVQRVASERGRNTPDPARLLPTSFKQSIRVPSYVNDGMLSLGYYSWSDDSFVANGLPRIRFIVLDTRARAFEFGTIDLIQLGWLYGELASALQNHEAVVIFAHHAPERLETGLHVRLNQTWLGTARPNDTAGSTYLPRMLAKFPNIVAYFYGHDHVNQEEVRAFRAAPNRAAPLRSSGPLPCANNTSGQHQIALIQTGSLAEFPQVARDVTLQLGTDGAGGYVADLSWRFVRAKPDCMHGQDLAGALAASWSESVTAHSESKLRQFIHGIIALIPPSYNKLATENEVQEASQSGTDVREDADDACILREQKRWKVHETANKPEAPQEQAMRIAFGFGACPSASEIFGCGDLTFINEWRCALGLNSIADACSVDARPSAVRWQAEAPRPAYVQPNTGASVVGAPGRAL